jgi:hypothetical protein
MSKPRSGGLRSKDLAVVPDPGPAARPAFDGTIASACKSAGISLEQMIEMMRWAKESDPRVALFLEGWDAHDPSERPDMRMVDIRCGQVGLAHVDLLKIVADVACRIAMYQAQIMTAVSHPLVVEKTIERALTNEGIADRTTLHKATGFLPMPKGSQTIISIMQNAQATTPAQSVAAPRPEDIIRRLANRFNEARGLACTATSVLTDSLCGQTFPDTIPGDEEGDGK